MQLVTTTETGGVVALSNTEALKESIMQEVCVILDEHMEDG